MKCMTRHDQKKLRWLWSQFSGYLNRDGPSANCRCRIHCVRNAYALSQICQVVFHCSTTPPQSELHVAIEFLHILGQTFEGPRLAPSLCEVRPEKRRVLFYNPLDNKINDTDC